MAVVPKLEHLVTARDQVLVVRRETETVEGVLVDTADLERATHCCSAMHRVSYNIEEFSGVGIEFEQLEIARCDE